MKNRNLKFALKTVTEKKVLKAMRSMKKKKSAGKDGISQENLIMGTETLVVPLTRIINESIASGIVPKIWKDAVVTPILKKGRPKEERKLSTGELPPSGIKGVGKNCLRPNNKIFGRPQITARQSTPIQGRKINNDSISIDATRLGAKLGREDGDRDPTMGPVSGIRHIMPEIILQEAQGVWL